MKQKIFILFLMLFVIANTGLMAENWFSGYLKDSNITSKVKARLFKNDDINGFRIKVTTDEGVVHLRGKVAMTSEALLAVKLAQGVRRVKKVENHIIVDKPKLGKGEMKTHRTFFEKAVVDPSITGQVKTALLANQNVNGMKIRVTTRNGVVFLEGNIASKRERKLAGEIAKGVAGVKAVKNFLRVTK